MCAIIKLKLKIRIMISKKMFEKNECYFALKKDKQVTNVMCIRGVTVYCCA